MWKEFKIAQIVPCSCLQYTQKNIYHMCLAQFVDYNNTYSSFYRRMKSEGKYVILDNGVAENMQLSTDAFFEKILWIRPSEIILPDTLLDRQSTIKKSIKAYEQLSSKLISLNIKIMAVPQGKTVEEWFDCAKTLLSEIDVDTIGIPKLLTNASNDDYARLKAAQLVNEWVHNNNRDIEIHLLGCNESPETIKKIWQSSSEIVRGCDSSFAYLCSKSGIEINATTPRPKGSIDLLNDVDHKNLIQNMHYFEVACGVTDNTNNVGWL